MGFNEVSRTMYKARNKSLPKAPKTVEDIQEAFKLDFVMEKYGTTQRTKEHEKRPFFKHAYECEEYAFCVFASDDVINAITENVPENKRRIYADGTFKITPYGIFKQILIVFGELNESVSLI